MQGGHGGGDAQLGVALNLRILGCRDAQRLPARVGFGGKGDELVDQCFTQRVQRGRCQFVQAQRWAVAAFVFGFRGRQQHDHAETVANWAAARRAEVVKPVRDEFSIRQGSIPVNAPFQLKETLCPLVTKLRSEPQRGSTSPRRTSRSRRRSTVRCSAGRCRRRAPSTAAISMRTRTVKPLRE
ncbi:Uncharacterised protein [Mycobacteroides abscessus subsp. abscessus]|nr:Uncharacterised protein [Mycobacteroides abscessus subsp. abscessus]